MVVGFHDVVARRYSNWPDANVSLTMASILLAVGGCRDEGQIACRSRSGGRQKERG